MNLTRRQNEIINAALKLIALDGIENLTIKHISEAIGVTEPAIYRHFKNKSEIVRELIARFDREVTISETVTSEFEAIKAYIRKRLEQVCENPNLANVMFSEEMFLLNSEYQEMLQQMIYRHKTNLQNRFCLARKKGEIRNDIADDTLYRIVFGAVRLLVKQWGMCGRTFNLHEKGEELLDAYSKMLVLEEQKK